jgi:serine protease Do
MDNKNILPIIILNTVTTVVVVFGLAASHHHWQPFLASVIGNEVVQDTDAVLGTTTTKVIQEESSVIDVAQIADASVVSIIVSKDLPVIERGYDPFWGFFSDPFVRDMWADRYGRSGEVEYREQKIGGGTGFIITEDGLVVTNKHVVFDDDADYTVLLNDETKLPAEVIAKDPLNDIAVLKIKTEDDHSFKHLSLGDSDSLQVGQTVVAIGNALGDFRNTVSKGVVSGLARNLRAGNGRGMTEYLEGVIQTDAAINQGNSGGPLLNLAGEVIGVNVAVAAGAENIGFSIPIDSVKNTIEMVKNNGKIIRPIIGVRYVMVTPSMQRKNNLPVDYGAMVLRGESIDDLAVLPGSPAAEAGLAEYDIILKINGQRIDNENTLAREILKYNVDDTISLTVLKDGTEQNIEVTLIEAPEL